MRYLLPTTALMLVGLVLAWPYAMGNDGWLIVPVRIGDGAEVPAPSDTEMARPRYLGRTSDDEPYAVTADGASFDPGEPDVVRLDRLDARMTAADARDLALEAREGVYHRSAERLQLSGDIVLTSSDGYRFETERARIDLAKGTVIGSRPVRGTGPAGDLEASRFEIREGGDVLRFEGRVKVTLQPGGRTAAPAETGT